MKRTKGGRARPKARIAAKRVRQERAPPKARASASLDLQDELVATRERLTATSDILRVVAASPGNAEGALRKIAEITARLFDAVGVSFRIAGGDDFKVSVGVGQGAEQVSTNLWADPKVRPTVGGRNLPGTVVRENRQIHLPDLDHLDAEFADWPGPPVARRAGIRTMAGTPLRIKKRAIGALIVYRNVLQPFDSDELQLLESFADQAAIAIENTRLLNELRESLEQQTATSDVLKVISSSPGELHAVFEAMLANAVRICSATSGNLALYGDNTLRIAAMHGATAALRERRQRDPVVAPNSPLMHVVKTKALVVIDDLMADESYADLPIVKEARGRTFLGAPMLKGKELVGAISIYRRQVQPFTNKQIALVQNFAAQAVIAIENARLLSELRQRTTDLTEALEQQTATSEVLRIISSSPSELGPVFQTMLSNATRLCEANFGTLNLCEDGEFLLAATHNVPT